jgi:hypothetical protein
MAKYKADTQGAVMFGKQPTPDFKHGWILGFAAALEDDYSHANVKADILQAIGCWYDCVHGWDFCAPKREPEMVALAEKLATLAEGPGPDPSEIEDPSLFGQVWERVPFSWEK